VIVNRGLLKGGGVNLVEIVVSLQIRELRLKVGLACSCLARGTKYCNFGFGRFLERENHGFGFSF